MQAPTTALKVCVICEAFIETRRQKCSFGYGVAERHHQSILLRFSMRIASGKVVAGRVELDGELPEGASVTVLALEGHETFEADAETEKMLLESMVQCDDGRTTSFADFLSELRSRE
jgi:hypothetical protein